MARKTKKSAIGTSFHQVYLETTPAILTQLFPESNEGESGDGKCQMSFILETEDGDVFTIYDWKEYRMLGSDEVVQFHIGARSRAVSVVALKEVMQMIKVLSQE
jgi:hypothetical protein